MGRKIEKERVEREQNTKVKRKIIMRKMKIRNEMKRKSHQERREIKINN